MSVPVPLVVASDIDGTLLRSDGTVSPATATALARAEAEGLHVVLVSARPPRWAQQLRAHVAAHGTVVCANGAAVLDLTSGALLDVSGFDRPRLRRLAEAVRAGLGSPTLAAETPEGFVHERGYVSIHPVPPGSPVGERVEDLVGDLTLKLLVHLAGRTTQMLAEAVGELGVVADSGAPGLGEIGPPGVTKAVALARWARRLGAAAPQVWAVGDAPNDLPMLRWAGVGFAVANAHPAVLAAADRICPANDEDGVAAVLDEALALRAVSRSA